MNHALRASLIALFALSLDACTPDAPIGANDDASSRADAPVTDAPVTDAPSTDVPVTDAPRLDAPVTDAPNDRPDACASAIATSDICCDVARADSVCAAVRAGGRPCHVCVQRVNAAGAPSLWMAVESPAECGCAPPTVEPPVDGGGPDAGGSCASNADCARGQVCEFSLGCAQTRGVCHDAGCQALPVAPQYCGCDGRTIQQTSACLPDRPYRAMGACPDAGPVDAGSADASADVTASDGGGLPLGAECTGGATCAAGLLCCYPCGIPGCVNRCSTPLGGRCPLLP